MAERIVFIHLPRESHAVPAGRLSLFEEGRHLRTSRFAYGQRYVQRRNAMDVDPASLPAELNPVAARLSRALEQLSRRASTARGPAR